MVAADIEKRRIVTVTKFPTPHDDLNIEVLKVMRQYPIDGSYTYWWPKDSSWEGTTQDIVYRGQKICTGDPQKRSYCCGLIFEVYMKACERILLARDFSADDAHELRLRFFGDSKLTRDTRRLVQHALVSRGLGTAVAQEDARQGDFVQFWRHSGSGHQAIFIEWMRKKGAIVGLRYWSTQKSTNGIGVNVERIDNEGIKRDEIYIVRARL